MNDERQARAKGIAGGFAIAALPVLCCGLPLLIASGVSVAMAAALGGAVVGAVVLAAALALLVLRQRRRRAGACRTPRPRSAGRSAGLGYSHISKRP